MYLELLLLFIWLTSLSLGFGSAEKPYKFMTLIAHNIVIFCNLKPSETYGHFNVILLKTFRNAFYSLLGRSNYRWMFSLHVKHMIL